MPPRILIAEDDDLQGSVLRSALMSRGYEADLVPDGLEAVRRLRTGRYDLALLDYHLPEVDGLSAARLLHEMLEEGERPGLIAVTVSAEGLREKDGGIGGTVFDAVVSKRLGLPALLSAVDANLTKSAKRNAASILERGRQAASDAAAQRRRRRRAPLAALPAFAMAGIFVAAIGWAATSLNHVDAVMEAAHRSDVLGLNAATLIGAVQDAETSQRTYLATGSPAHREQFQADAQRVDELLISAAPLAANGLPGFGEEAEPQAVIEPRLRMLAQEAEARRAGGAGAPLAASSYDTARGDAERLRDWAAGIVSTAQEAVFAGLAAIRGNVKLVLAVLGAGALYALWDAFRIVQRRWHPPRKATAMRDPRPGPGRDRWSTALAAPDSARPLLLHGG